METSSVPLSRQKLPCLVQWQPLKRPISISEFKQTSISRSTHSTRYNPLSDPQLKVYLGRKQLKTKLQQMGYVLNPEKTQILRKQVSKRKPLPSLALNRASNTKAVLKTSEEVRSVSKAELQNYIKLMREKLVPNSQQPK